MISIEYAGTKKVTTEQSPTGEYTKWFCVLGKTYVEIAIMISGALGRNADDDVVASAMEHGWVGVHHSGFGDIARGYAEREI